MDSTTPTTNIKNNPVKSKADIKTVKTDEALRIFNEELDKFYEQRNLIQIGYSDEVKLILDSSEIDKETWNPVKCLHNASVLFKYSMYLQQEIGRLNRAKLWAETNLNYLYGKYGFNYGSGYSRFDERMAMMIADNTAAFKCQQIVLDMKAKIGNLDKIANEVSAIGRALVELHKHKKYSQNPSM